VAAVRLSPFAALRHRNFRVFYIGQTTSLIGTWMQNLAQGWLVLQLTNSPFWVGLVSACTAVPVLVLSLPAGVWVDRSNKHRLVILGQIMYFVQAGLLTFLVETNVIRAWQVAGIALVVGAINAVEIPARQAFIVELVGKDDLTNAIALNSSAFNAARILGPTAAGFLVAHAGLSACFGLNTLSFVAVLIALWTMKMPVWTPPVLARTAAGRLGPIKDGLRFVRRDRKVLALVLHTTALSLLGFPFIVLLPVFARDVLKVGAQGLGVMTAVVGLGALISALGLAVFGSNMRRGRLVAFAGPTFGVAVAVFALSRWYPLALAMLLLAGFAMILNNASTNTLLQTLVPDEMRGRVMSIWSLVFVGFGPLGALALGAAAERIGADIAMAIGGTLCAIASLLMWTRGAPEVARLR